MEGNAATDKKHTTEPQRGLAATKKQKLTTEAQRDVAATKEL